MYNFESINFYSPNLGDEWYGCRSWITVIYLYLVMCKLIHDLKISVWACIKNLLNVFILIDFKVMSTLRISSDCLLSYKCYKFLYIYKGLQSHLYKFLKFKNPVAMISKQLHLISFINWISSTQLYIYYIFLLVYAT